MAKLVRTNGTIEDVSVNQTMDYKQMQGYVGGCIEAITLDNNFIMWCNEEGKLNGLPLNATATRIFHDIFGPQDVIVGDVLITNTTESGDGRGRKQYPIHNVSAPNCEPAEYTDWDALGMVRMELYFENENGEWELG